MTKPSNSAAFSITLSVAFVLLGVILFAMMLGLVPDGAESEAARRVSLCKNVAVNASLSIQRRDRMLLRQSLAATLEMNPEIVQAVVRRRDGEVLHSERSVEELPDLRDKVVVPVTVDGEAWGSIELAFTPIVKGGLRLTERPTLNLLAFIGSAAFLVVYIYLNRILRHLDPSRVVPERVRTTLDTLTEGLLVVDADCNIVLANCTIARLLGESPDELIGRPISNLPWDDVKDDFPWSTAMASRKASTGSVIRMLDLNGEARTFRVNSAPILVEDGQCEGALTSFDDVTALEHRTRALTEMLDRLKTSRDKIRRQNEELHVLATRDPLTTSLNRRSFFEAVTPIWQNSVESDIPLSCCMVDIDNFKSVNDNYGHAIGDYVLKKTVELITEAARDFDLICRYGGEEFCVMFPNTNASQAYEIAERFRKSIEAFNFNGLSVTSSFGVAGMEHGASDFQGMLDQADQGLYFAKRSGRNRTRLFSQVPSTFEMQTTPDSHSHRSQSRSPTPIPVQTVSCLLSALAYRDIGTAEHSRRVADLCVRMSDGLLSCSESYVLENAALLHDIGKIGVPDNILLKPGALNEEEWKIMRSHDEISVEIIRSTFVCHELTEIVRTHHAWFDGNPVEPNLPTGNEIPLPSRILAIADAYDAMVSDRVYRQGLEKDKALAELRRCAGTQFDPHLVERFVAIVSRLDDTKVDALPVADKRAALKLGVEIERLARAIDDEDTESLRKLAENVQQIAEDCSFPSIIELTEEIKSSIGEDQDDWLNTLELTIELIELCRTAQRVHLDTRAACQHVSSMTQRSSNCAAPALSLSSEELATA